MTTNQPYADLVKAAIDEARDELVAVSKDIHAHPELNYQETYSSAALATALERHGFSVERGTGGVETAFRAEAQGQGGDGPTVAFLAEYDALPDIGHGCGHNLIAISNLGAMIGAVRALRDLPGKLVILGTPAEEGGGGKVRMIDGGAFSDVDISLSSHPSSNITVIPTNIAMDESWSLAMVGYRYAYHGKASHASTVPHEGINALNSVIHLFTGIDALRQHLKEDVRIHGVITDGGKAPNVVPDFAAANFMLRSRDSLYLREVVEKVQRVAEGAALLTGATSGNRGSLPAVRKRQTQRGPRPHRLRQLPPVRLGGARDPHQPWWRSVHRLRQREPADAFLLPEVCRERGTRTRALHSHDGGRHHGPSPRERNRHRQGAGADGVRPAYESRVGGAGEE